MAKFCYWIHMVVEYRIGDPPRREEWHGGCYVEGLQPLTSPDDFMKMPQIPGTAQAAAKEMGLPEGIKVNIRVLGFSEFKPLILQAPAAGGFARA